MIDLAIFAVARRGTALGMRLAQGLDGDLYVPERLGTMAAGGQSPRVLTFGPGGIRRSLEGAFDRYREIVLVLPVGAAVRLVAPLVENKRTDPAVVALDEAGAYAVALISGHSGGANELARAVGAAVGAHPVITTAAEALGLPALDLLGHEWCWSIEAGSEQLTRASAALIDGDLVGAYQDAGEESWWTGLPANVLRYPSLDALMSAPVAARLVISDRTLADLKIEVPPPATILYRPKTLVVGVGCVRGATADEMEALVCATLEGHGLAGASVAEIATIDLKRDEPGIAELSKRRGWPVRYCSAQELAAAAAPSGGSDVVERAVGTPAVCEPAALRAAGARALVVPKVSTRRVTVAIARRVAEATQGHLAVVGLGPGELAHMTRAARDALEAADVVIGYHGYVDLVRVWLGPKQYHGSPIGAETDRCRLAIDLWRAGRRVALVSSGDAGVYGTAGIVFELLAGDGAEEESAGVEVVPGVSAAQAAAALLGAPLMNDFAAISLSDLLTPWSLIERRLEAAASADLVVALYNPASSRRTEQLSRAQEILLRHRSPGTPVGIVRNAFRSGQQVTITELGRLLDHPVDMLTIVVVGNSATIRVGDRLATRRGYA